MIDSVLIPKRELEALEARANRLAQEKSHLQLLTHLMNRLSSVPGLDTMIEAMLQILLDTMGGSNLILYYFLEDEMYTADVFGVKEKIEEITDPLVQKVLETRQFIEYEHDFKDTKMLTPPFTKATTWIVPLMVGEENVGVLKMEGLHIGTRELQSQLPTFFNYAALLLKNEIAGHLRLTKAQERLREKEMLLKEIHHRVKNNLQVVSSLLSMQAQSASDEKVRELFRESVARVRSMALVHERLYGSQNLAQIDFGEYVRGMINDLIRGINRHGIDCTVNVEPVSLGIDVAIPSGLILNELVSNAFKHAFVGRSGGTVTVTLSRLPDNKARFIVHDDGVGFPKDIDFHTARTMGLTLVVSLVEQLSGSVTMNNTDGTCWDVEFPL